MTPNKVLVAEDDRVTRMVLERSLVKWNYKVVSVSDGKEAWARLKAEPDISVAVLDWMMPGVSGIDLCRRIREEPSLDILYIILLTGRETTSDMVQGLEAGADDYIVKPFEYVELRSRLRVGFRMVESKRLLREKNEQLTRFANEMESLAEERAKMLVHADRLASLGTLTAGVAHEVNNPTTFISGNAQTIQQCWSYLEPILDRYLPESFPESKKLQLIRDELPAMVKGIREGVKRIHSIVKGLKSFARVGKNEPTVCNIHEIIEGALMLCGNTLKYHTRVVKNFQAQEPHVFVDHQLMEQVFINLFVNASDAMKNHTEQGVLTIITENSQGFLRITVEDNGPGIPADALDKVWKPFFTTKLEEGKGTGLGLSISQGIIQDHQGEIRVENKEAGGAAFTINLPLAEIN